MMSLFDFAKVPFSRHQRFTTISMMPESGGQACYLRYVAGGDTRESLGKLCKIEFFDLAGKKLSTAYELAPHCLTATLSHSGKDVGKARFAIGQGEELYLSVENAEVRFSLEGSRYDYAYKNPQGAHCVVAAGENLRLTPQVKHGEVAVSGEWRRDHAENVAIRFLGQSVEGRILLHQRLCPDTVFHAFDDVCAMAREEFDAWHGKPRHADEAAVLASYILWANTVPAGGKLSVPAIYMSKNHMINIWAWDNAFSAIGVAARHPQLAFDQFAAIFDHQDESGLLPDFVNDQGALFAFTKPPVHGWAIEHITHWVGDVFSKTQLRYLRKKLELQLDYWLAHTRASENELPSYAHGNDSGWDNASFFANGGPVIGPDLPTFLALTARSIAKICRLEGDENRAVHFDQVKGHLIDMLVDQLWLNGAFIAKKSDGSAVPENSKSLIRYMPMLLGDDLPQDIAQALVSDFVRSDMLTAWGPATESPSSDFYEADGYWRGPIWAPTTLLIFDGLMRQGATEEGLEVAERFKNLCEKSGMAENFDALSGAGLRDPAFAWTSAVYLRFCAILASQNGSSI
jgi:glycogen debranching enzyme